MVGGPDDLPDRRAPDPAGRFRYTAAFNAALEEFVPDATQRFYFRRDGIEFRLSHAIDLQLITPGQGYLITEEYVAAVPECIIWFRVGESEDGPPVYTLDTITVRQPPADDEDDS